MREAAFEALTLVAGGGALGPRLVAEISLWSGVTGSGGGPGLNVEASVTVSTRRPGIRDDVLGETPADEAAGEADRR